MEAIVIYGTGSPILPDIEESLLRAGIEIGAAMQNRPGESFLLTRRALRKGERGSVWLSIRNLSARVLQPGSLGLHAPNALISYHWYRDANGAPAIHTWDSPRAHLPTRLESGESACMYLPIEAPQEPAEYRLQADLVEEGVGWASSCVDIPTYRIEMTE